MRFGRRFFELAVTESRASGGICLDRGRGFDVGPLPTGPGGVVKVLARVKIDEPGITRSVEDLIRFTVQIPLPDQHRDRPEARSAAPTSTD